MNTNDIILSINAEISRLQQAKALLSQTSGLTPAKRKPGRPHPGVAKQPALIRQTLMPTPQSAEK
jgi:hypothetical protein